MLPRPRALACALVFVLVFVQVPFLHCSPADSWKGALRDAGGKPVAMATVKLVSADSQGEYSATTSATGEFAFIAVTAGDCTNTGNATGQKLTGEGSLIIKNRGPPTTHSQTTHTTAAVFFSIIP